MNAPTIEEAWALHAQKKFPRYKGPKIAGRRSVVYQGMEGYPDAFAGIPEPPGALYVIGDAGALMEGLAVVGARKATPYGIACTRLFAGRAAQKGVVIISGGALGCDSVAHQAAIEQGCPTVAFLGGGLDEVYPAANAGLFQDIVDHGGALVSENSWGYPALPHTFRARNRLIAGLARATLIAEAGLPSGTFSTADEALAANREVLVVPGSICSVTSKGANRLLYQGATPVVDLESFDDILFALFGCLKQEEAKGAPPSEDGSDALLGALRANPLRMEEMLSLIKAEKGQDAFAMLMTHLTQLQKTGKVARYPDGRFGPARL